MFESRMPVLRSLIKNRLLQVTLFSLILVGVAAPLARVAPSKAQELQPIDGSRYFLLVEQGSVLPSQLLAGVENVGIAGISTPDSSNRPIFSESVNLPQQFKAGASFDVTFNISGNARFDNPQGGIAIIRAKNGVIKIPPIVAGPSFGHSFINVMVDGQTVIEKLRVATVDKGDIEKFKGYIEADDPGIIVLGDHYAVIDESRLKGTTQTISVQIELPPDGDVTIIEDSQNRVTTNASGVCDSRPPWGPGRVNWHGYTSILNPWAWEGWAYKPEGFIAMYRANDLASDSIDALYKRSWGCNRNPGWNVPNRALKVPDNCTVNITGGNSTITGCCNAAFSIFWRIEWIYADTLKAWGWASCGVPGSLF
jgi:hypothetical protein